MIADIIGNNAILLQSAASPWHYIYFTQRALYIFAPGITKDGANAAARTASLMFMPVLYQFTHRSPTPSN